MKNIILFLVSLFFALNIFGQGEWVRASIDNGVIPNTTALYISTNTEFDANKCDNIVFTVRVPKIAGSAITVTESFKAASISHISFNIQKLNVDDGTYYYYLVNGTGTVQVAPGTIYPINTPIRLIELTYDGGVTNGLVELVNIENDIPGNLFLRPQFFIQINLGDITNQTAMFYGTGTAMPVNNQPVTGDDFVSTAAAVVLPVRFISFLVLKNGDNAQISWVAENESANASHYEIERSLNGNSFERIQIMPVRNNGNNSNAYTTNDQQLTSLRSTGRIYYRIKQVDRDGRFIYTDIKSVQTGESYFAATVYPNPVSNYCQVSMALPEDAKIQITLTDVSGKRINTITAKGVMGLNVYKLNMSGLASGTYFIKVSYNGLDKVLPVIKN